VVVFIIPSIAEDDSGGFARTGTMTALLFLTPGAVMQLIAAPPAERLAVRTGFVTMLRVGIIQAPDDAPGSLPGVATAAFAVGAMALRRYRTRGLVFSRVLKPKPGPLVHVHGGGPATCRTSSCSPPTMRRRRS
jgi:hypothetical protein